MRAVYLALTVLPLLALIGCGPSSGAVKVTGKVTYKGAAAEGAEVLFMPDSGRPAVGVTDASGAFTLTTEAPNDGALPGSYKVGIGEYYPPGKTPPMPSPGQVIPSKFPSKYSNPQSSGLTADVSKSGKNDFIFELK